MYSPCISLFFFITMTFLVFNHLKCEARDRIDRGNPLNDSGDTLVSAGNRFQLGFFTPEGNLKRNRYIGIWYYDSIPATISIVWVANRDNPVPDCSGVFGIAGDGNVKIWCNNGSVFPVTKLEASTTFNMTLQLLDSGNLILYKGHTRLWQSFDFPTDTFLPGMKMNDNVKLTSWISPSDPASGDYEFHSDQGVYMIENRTSLHWKSGLVGPLHNFLYNELPNLVGQILLGNDTQLGQKTNRSVVGNTENISFPNKTEAFDFNNSRLLMHLSGEIRYYNNNSLLWSAPQNNPCSVYDPCGKFASCNINYEPLCQCLQGFEPASPVDWEDGKYSGGCKSKSMCSPHDGFLNLTLMKIDGQVKSFDQAQEEATCKEECLNNCECTAYTYGADVPNREIVDSTAKCQIWTNDLKNLQKGNTDDRVRLSLRVPFSSTVQSGSRICQPCVTNLIPYPLSIRPDCGDPLYSGFYCNHSTGEISFAALSGKYQVIGISPEKRRFVILVNSESADICNDTKLSSQIVKLNQSLPFFVTNWCYNFSADPESRMGNHVELGWKLPLEPICNSSVGCKDWPNSGCLDKGDGQRRCYCNQGYRWNDLRANCTEASTSLMKGSEGSKNKIRKRYVVVFTILLVGAILAFCCSYILHRRRRMVEGSGNRGSTEADPVLFLYERERQVIDMMHETEKSVDVPFYSLDTILSATDNFSDANKLGHGGFGPVYKGKFPGGHEIAVKRLSSCSNQGVDEFLNEVILIARLQHRNLVRLLGYCIKENEKILLYEYMPNRSLDAFIFDQNDYVFMDWKKRLDIILGIARGLLYLHQDSRLRIIHRDLKTSNILLDEEMNPKISDFGLARIIEGKRTEASTNKVVGTFGYMSPEYALDGKFSIKSDVFSFGVVMLEIISGKKNSGFYHPQEVMNLLGYAWRLWSENKAIDLLDPKLMESCEKSQVTTCINIGLLCVQEDPNDRPSMSTVIIMLGSESATLPTPTQPAFVIRRRVSTTSSSSSMKPDTISNNELTISIAEGR